MIVTLTNQEQVQLGELARERGELIDQCAANLIREQLAIESSTA